MAPRGKSAALRSFASCERTLTAMLDEDDDFEDSRAFSDTLRQQAGRFEVTTEPEIPDDTAALREAAGARPARQEPESMSTILRRSAGRHA
jgi:hypothetical protein